MSRLLLCLPLCLLLASDEPRAVRADPPAVPLASNEPLPDKDPLAFLEKCLAGYDRRGIQGYHLKFHKQERIQGELKPSELIEVWFREKPHSVFFRWHKGQRKANAALYVEGAHDGKMLANPAGIAGRLVKVAARDVDGPDARESGRYTLKEFGLRNAALRILKAWRAAAEQNALQVEYLGLRKIAEAGNRECYVLRRHHARPEDDGILELTVYVDKELHFPVGTVAKGEGGRLIGEYVFRDIRLNPAFDAQQFDRAMLTR